MIEDMRVQEYDQIKVQIEVNWWRRRWKSYMYLLTVLLLAIQQNYLRKDDE